MLNNNNSAMEDLYSANYVENFLDVIENMPDEVQRDITKMRELDVNYQDLLNDIDNLFKDLQSKENGDVSCVKRLLVQLQNKLILSQEVADDKIASVQHMLDVIEGKQQNLDADSKKLVDFETENERCEGPSRDRPEGERPNKRPRRTPRADGAANSSSASIAATISSAISNSGGTNTMPTQSLSSAQSTNTHVDRILRQDSPHTVSEKPGNNSKNNTNKNIGPKKQTAAAAAAVAAAASAAAATAAAAAKKKQRRRGRTDREDSPTEIPIDPDEPTYCVCEQVSYGEMIGCDNDLCPIEWFHFSCVNLTHKPKGKWYCPRCRGDKPTVMKPKAILNKELMQYNKEKEERS